MAWKVRGIPPRGVVPSTAVITWIAECPIANPDPNGDAYTGSQMVAAELGKVYRVSLTDDGVPSIQSQPIGNTTSDYITIENDTNLELDIGVTIDGAFVAVQTVTGGEQLNFASEPTFYICGVLPKYQSRSER